MALTRKNPAGESKPSAGALSLATDGLGREELLEWLGDAAKLWLAHDGFWFRAVEDSHGLGEAIALDEKAMAAWTVVEAGRIQDRLGLRSGGGLTALERALGARLYALLNTQEARRERGPDGERLVFTMKTCRVQDARNRRGLQPFPCRSVGLLEYGEFAKTIDPRIRTTCRHCPPDRVPEGEWCCWEFAIGTGQ